MFSNEKLDINLLDTIFNRMIEVITSSKDDVFTISEQSRQTYENMQKELEVVRQELSLVITEGDALEQSTKLAKQRLVTVSKSFSNYTEQQVKDAYETANDFQIKLTVNRTQEKQLRDKRDDLERRLKALYDTIERADHIVNQVNVVLNYLTTDLRNVGLALEQAKMNKEFGIRIIEAQEEERKRLSREIHDGPAQMMANVLMRSDLIERTYRERGIEKAIEEISHLKVNVRNALSEVRRIIYDLRPMALDDLGIVPTLRKYLMTVEEYNPGVTIHFQSLSKEQRLSTNYEVSFFRLVQECVTNSLKHSKSKEIWVKLEWLKDSVNIVIKDQGVGFDPNIVKDNSFGLIGIRERIEILKGSFNIDSAPGKGTTVIFKIPINVE